MNNEDLQHWSKLTFRKPLYFLFQSSLENSISGDRPKVQEASM